MNTFCRPSLQALMCLTAVQHGMQPHDLQMQGSTAQHSTAQHSAAQRSAAQRITAQHRTAQHLKNLIQALGRERCERHLCQLVIQASGCRFGQVIQHCQAPQQASHLHRANSLQSTTRHTSLMMRNTALTCACKPGCTCLRCHIA